MLAAVALVAYLVHPGDTLSGIAASHGVSLAAVEAANSHLANPSLIYAGQTVEIPEGSSASHGSSATQTSTALPALKSLLGPKGATVLEPAPAIDTNVFAVTQATASQYHLTTLSSLALPVAAA